jgi:hypothetical protein
MVLPVKRYYSSNATPTTITTALNNSSLTFPVASLSGWPVNYPFTAVLEKDTVNEEIVDVSGASGLTLTVARGVGGTAAVSHSSGSALVHAVDGRDFNSFATHISAASGVHNVVGNVVGDTDAQTLTNKIISAATNTISGLAIAATTGLQSALDVLTSAASSAQTTANTAVANTASNLAAINAQYSNVTIDNLLSTNATNSTSLLTSTLSGAITPSSVTAGGDVVADSTGLKSTKMRAVQDLQTATPISPPSTSYTSTNGTPFFIAPITFTAPPSGMVKVTVGGQINAYTNTTWLTHQMLAADGVTVAFAQDEHSSLICAPSSNVSASKAFLYTSLNPGTIYKLDTMTRVGAAAGGTIASIIRIVEPML